MKIRSIRPEFFADPKMVKLSAEARVLYMGLWCYVDDEGRGEFLPKRIEGDVFPLEDVDFWDLWSELEGLGRVVRYEAEGHEYFYIPTFERWQKPNRKYESKLPEPPADSEDAARTQRVDTAPAHAVEGEVEGEVASTAFVEFNAARAVEAVDKRMRNGLVVKSRNGLAKTIQKDPDHIAESKRLWEHRDCGECGGRGFLEEYSPGAGMRQVECSS